MITADTSTPVRDVSVADSHEVEDPPAIAGAALDLLLTEAGLGTRARFLPGRETVRLVTRVARRPGRVLRRRVASLTLGVCVIDNEHSNVLNAFSTEQVKNVALASSARKGYLDGRDLASVFLWLRPNDLIWPYVVNNWLLGNEPPAFDILYWNADTTRMPAALHRDFIEIATQNSMRRPGAVTVLGSPVDLGRITVDSYFVAGAADHISRWQNCYRTTQLLGGRTHFVLSTSGHIAAIVNPPGNPRATYRTASEQTPPDPAQWEELATTSQGTWWADWDEWLAERSGGMRPAPARLGNKRHKIAGAAPGEYVLEP